MGCDWNICLNLNVWDVFWMNQVQMRECRRKVMNGKRLAGGTRSLVNSRGLQLECARVFLESLLIPVLMYGSETMV